MSCCDELLLSVGWLLRVFLCLLLFLLWFEFIVYFALGQFPGVDMLWGLFLGSL